MLNTSANKSYETQIKIFISKNNAVELVMSLTYCNNQILVEVISMCLCLVPLLHCSQKPS